MFIWGNKIFWWFEIEIKAVSGKMCCCLYGGLFSCYPPVSPCCLAQLHSHPGSEQGPHVALLSEFTCPKCPSESTPCKAMFFFSIPPSRKKYFFNASVLVSCLRKESDEDSSDQVLCEINGRTHCFIALWIYTFEKKSPVDPQLMHLSVNKGIFRISGTGLLAGAEWCTVFYIDFFKSQHKASVSNLF